MTHCHDIDELKAKRICFECVGETYLSDEIEQTGNSDECSYCGQTAESWTIKQLSDRIEIAFDDHYFRTSDQPNSWQQSLLSDRESDYEWERDGVPVVDAIRDAADLPEDAASDVQTILEEEHSDFDLAAIGEEAGFSSSSYYEELGPSDREWQEEWRTFERSLKTEARFFSRIAASHLASVFGGIDKLSSLDGRPLIVDAGPQLAIDHLYRARVFQSDEKLEEALCRPDLHLGSPPASIASAGRMNARGISVFYGATEPNAAIAEVRPPVGSRVAIAKFDLIRPLRLLDLTALTSVQDGGSIFDSSLRRRLERVAFLRSLGQRMTRPVMPDDEVFDYLATQAIADFLATENEPMLDGIIFRSAQAEKGRNVVLFHKAARIEALELPKGTEIEARTGHVTEDGWDVDYAVTERVPPSQIQSEKGGNCGAFELSHFGLPHNPGDDFRENALRIDPESVMVHHVEWVEYQCTAYQVDRHRYEKQDTWEF